MEAKKLVTKILCVFHLSLFVYTSLILHGCNADTNIVAKLKQNELPSIIYSQETIILPDIIVNGYNQGFTCTGMTYSSSENSFYIVNFGRRLPEDEEFFPSIVQMSTDGNIFSQIPIYETISKNVNIQGITYDSSDGSLWFCDVINNKIYRISRDGDVLGNIDYSTPNGIAYDSRTDSLWVINNSSESGNACIKNIDKYGKERITISLSEVYHTDQLFLDETNDLLYFSAGANYQGDNFIYSLSLSEHIYRKEYILKDSYAIEGIYLANNTLYVCNDGFYHSSLTNTNEIKIYNLFG